MGSTPRRQPLMPLLIRGLSFSYRNTKVFDSFSFTTSDRIVVLRGPSGCGKTTLLKILSRNLIPDHVVEISAPQKTLMLVQEDALAPWLTGIDNISRFTGVARADVEGHPAFMHIRPFLYRRACEMSYGQRRLIELTRATLIVPSLLCLDEPFNFLDPRSRRIFTEILLNDALLPDTQIMITSHYLEDFEAQKITQFEFDGDLPVSQLCLREGGRS